MAIFQLTGERAGVLELRSAAPILRQRVWLVAQVVGGASADVRLHAATLVSVNGEWIEFAYDNATVDLTATSGAPVVDEDGRVIGINIGGKVEGKKLIGVAQSSDVVLGAMDRALAAAKTSVRADKSREH